MAIEGGIGKQGELFSLASSLRVIWQPSLYCNLFETRSYSSAGYLIFLSAKTNDVGFDISLYLVLSSPPHFKIVLLFQKVLGEMGGWSLHFWGKTLLNKQCLSMDTYIRIAGSTFSGITFCNPKARKI